MKERKTIYKLLAMLLCLAMIVGMFPAIDLIPAAQAADQTGTCGGSHDHATGWKSLNEAFAAAEVSAESGDKFGFKNLSGNFYLTADLEMDTSIRFNGATHLDLNGYTIKAKTGVSYQNGTLLHVASTFTLCDSSEDQTGTIDGLYDGTNASSAATLTVLMRVYYTTATMYGGTIKGLHASAERSGAVRIDGPNWGVFIMEGGKITGNKSTGNRSAGGVTCETGTTFTMNGGEISGNHGSAAGVSYASGGAVTLYGAGSATTFNMTGGTITGNTAYRGGAVWAYAAAAGSKAVINISGGSISGNTELDSSNQGDVYFQTALCELHISGNPTVNNVKCYSGTTDIGELTEGASIKSVYQIPKMPVNDTTVKEEGADYDWTYTFDAGSVTPPIDPTDPTDPTDPPDPELPPEADIAGPGACDDHDTTHDGWFQLGDPNSETPVNVIEGNIRGNENGKYVLVSDVHMSGTMWMHAFKNKNIHICLNGHTLTSAATPVICIPGNIESLTICDCQGGGMIDCSKGSNVNGSYNQGAIVSGAKGTVNLYGGTVTGIDGTVPGAIATTSDNSVVNIYGGSISGNIFSSENGGAINMNKGKLTVYGGNISNNTIDGNGGGIYVADYYLSAAYHVAVDIKGGTILGDVYQAGQGVVKISGSAVIDSVVLARGAKNVEIGELEEGATIYANAQLNAVDDGTVLFSIDPVTGLYRYRYYDRQYGLIINAAAGVINDNWIKVAEGSNPTQLSVNYEDYFNLKEGSYTLSWISEDPRVATVDANGKITYVGPGSTVINVVALDSNNQPTDFCAYVNVQVGEYLKVLVLGNESSRDSLFYLSKLAALSGQKIQAAYLYDQDANLRDHAHNLGLNLAAYTYYSTFVGTGEMEKIKEGVRATQVLEDNDWDVVILQHGVNVGWSTTYNSDLEYLIDYVRGEEPGAKLYWNMAWANQADYAGTYANWDSYDKNQQVMYNAIVSCLEDFVIGEDSRYGEGFDGYILTGTAIQNLRATYGDILTRDGYHLSLQAGRLTAAMTVLQELASDETLGLTVDMSKITADALDDILAASDGDITADAYDNTQANLDKVKAAVQAACTTVIPTKFANATTPDTNPNADTMIGYVDPPNYLIQPDIIALSDGSYIAYAQISPVHAADNERQSGSVTTVFFKGEENAAGEIVWDFANPTLTIDEAQIEKWGIVRYTDRYARIQDGTLAPASAPVTSEFGESNFDIIYLDHDGNPATEEVATLTVTCWGNYFTEGSSLSRRGFMVWSFDNGETWPGFQMMETSHNNPVLKRGSMAIFDNDQILMPFYGFGYNGCLLLEWNPATQKWDLNGDYNIPNTSPSESTDFTEIALVSPNGGDVVFAMIRASGAILKSEDRGQTWVEIANEPGIIDQPSFVILDEERVFAIWSKKPDARKIYGKVFYVNGDWTDTRTQLIYETPLTTHHDVGGPHAAIIHGSELGSEQLIAVAYDAGFTGITTVYLDLSEEKWLPVELQDNASSEIADLTAPIEGNYTVEAQVKFAAADGSVIVNTSAGPLTIEAGEFVLNETVNIRVSVVGGAIFWKAWQGTEPASFNYMNGQRTNELKTEIICDGAECEAFTVSKNIAITINESAVLTEGGASLQLEATVMPAQEDQVWSSSDETVATVDQDGVITPVSAGTCEVYLTAGGVKATCKVTVNEKPAELTGKGEKNYIVNDSFEGYEIVAGVENNDAFWNAHWAGPENSDYHFNVAQDAKGDKTYYNIKDENGTSIWS